MVFSIDAAALFDYGVENPAARPLILAGDWQGLLNLDPAAFTVRNVGGSGPIVLDVGVLAAAAGLARGDGSYAPFADALASGDPTLLGRGFGDPYRDVGPLGNEARGLDVAAGGQGTLYAPASSTPNGGALVVAALLALAMRRRR